VAKITVAARRAKAIEETGVCPDHETCPHKEGKRLWAAWAMREILLPLAPIAVVFLYRNAKLDPGELHSWRLLREVARGPELPFVTVMLLSATFVGVFATYKHMRSELHVRRTALVALATIVALLALAVAFSLVAYYDTTLAFERGRDAVMEWVAGGGVGHPPPIPPNPRDALDAWTTTHIWYMLIAVALSAGADLFAEWANRK
jgi:hypothetical protein